MKRKQESQSNSRANSTTRRSFLGATSALTGLAVTRHAGGQDTLPAVHVGGTDEIRIALIGCGGRGAGAAADAMSVPSAPVTLYAMADIFRQQIDNKRKGLTNQFKEHVNVTDERCFVGVNAYRDAIDSLRPGVDIAVFATPPGTLRGGSRAGVGEGINPFPSVNIHWIRINLVKFG